jgi:hypothetical protein
MDITTIRYNRKQLSMLLNSLPVSPTANGRYTALAKTNLEEGRMWMGKILGLIGDAYPYSEKNIEAVDVTDEKVDFEKHGRYSDENKINLIRKLLDLQADYIISCDSYVIEFQTTVEDMLKLQIAIRNAYTGVMQSRMWLGMELAELFKIKGGQ